MKIYVGCCGLPMSLEKYFKKFEVVELNSTFYKLPQIDTAKKWRETASKKFNFTVKCYQAITHPTTSPTWKKSGLKENELKKIEGKVGFLKPTEEVFEAWDKNLEICKVLRARVCVIQLPASFRENEENIANAEEFFKKIKRDDISIALELRGWNKEKFKEICKKFDMISCVDYFKDEPLWFGKEKIGYFRLHGSYEKGKLSYNYKYSRKELEELKSKVMDLKVKEVYILFNNRFMKDDAIEFLSCVHSKEKVCK